MPRPHATLPPAMTTLVDYVLDPDDPRAPTHEQWTAMSEEQREHVVASLPSDVPFELFLPEGDLHRKAKSRAVDALDGFFRRIGRRVYVSSELAVYYPGQPRFAPDVLAVLDVEPHERMSWVVQREGKGLDLVLEIHVAGDIKKDYDGNRKRYAALGIPEYFLFDRTRDRLLGWRLPSSEAPAYEPIVPQKGLLASQVLGLELALEADRLRFYFGGAAVPESEDLVARLEFTVEDLVARREQAQQAREAAHRELERESKAREHAEREREEALRKVAALEAELKRLRRRE